MGAYKPFRWQEFVKAGQKIAAKFPDKALKALYLKGQLIMTESKRLCPVGSPHGGELRNSGQVHEPERRGNVISVTLSYGSGPSAPYAVAVHEHLSEFSPPSWKKAEANGDGVHWRIAGTGPKFLEKPLNEARQTIGEWLAQHIRLDEEGSVVAFVDDIEARLVANAVGVSGTTLFSKSSAMIPNGDGPYVTIVETGGSGFSRTHNDSTVEMPTMQVCARAKSPSAARAKAVAAFDALGGANGLWNVTLGTTFYLSVKARQNVSDIGLDASGRAMFVFNIDAEKKPS